MTNEEIRDAIFEKQQAIREKQDYANFTLNREIIVLAKEIGQLQAQCTHHFVNGICEYCDKREK